MVRRHKRYAVKTTWRMIVIFLFFGTIISTLGYTLFNNLYRVNELKKELKKLEEKEISLLEEEEVLNADIKRLSDPLYVARYVREKYLYSKDGRTNFKI